MKAATQQHLAIAMPALVAVATLLLDYLTPLGVAAAVPYALFVLLSLWHGGRVAPVAFALIATALTLVGYLLSPPPVQPGEAWTVLANRALALVVIWVTAALCLWQLRTTEALRDSEGRLRAVVETATDAVVMIDERGIIQQVNPACERLFGYGADELIGRNVAMLMEAGESEAHHFHIGRCLETGEPLAIGRTREVRARRRDGATIPVRVAVGEARFHDRPLFTALIHDLTEQKRTEQALDELRSELYRVSRITELGAMASAIAHETNQPLTAVSNYLATLKRLMRPGEPVPEQAAVILEKALIQTERATAVIGSVRGMAHYSDGERRPEPVNEIVHDALDLALLGTRRLGLDVQLDLADGLPECRVNRTQIQQVVVNLVGNAADALADAEVRRLRITTRMVPEGGVQVDVADTGPGLAPEVRAQLFRPFVTTKPEGIGIGLSICHSILESHGGRLWTEPRDASGGGTRFSFLLPDARANPVRALDG